ncbi:MAG: hypothetical protein ACT4QC_07735 [Planctomycetaceae bacterium]
MFHQFGAPIWALSGLLSLSLTLGSALAAGEAEPAQIDDPAHFDELAAALQQKSNALCWELHRHHQQQPDFRETYRAAKELWSEAGAFRDALSAGTVATAALSQQVRAMNDRFARVEAATNGWGDGEMPVTPDAREERMVVVPGSRFNVEIPLLFGGGIQVGRPPQVVVAPQPGPGLARRMLHPHAHGSKRALVRQLEATGLALGYLSEDLSVGSPGDPRPAPAESAAPSAESNLSPPQKILPPSAKK